MHLDVKQLEKKDVYAILSSLIIPRPIGWVSSISKGGFSNIAPFSFFNVMGVDPPIVAFAPGNKKSGDPKDTAQNIIDTKEFVVNLVHEELFSAMVESAKPHEPSVSEIELTGLTPLSSLDVKPPRIKEAQVSLECKLERILNIGNNRMVIGEITQIHMDDKIFDPSEMKVLSSDYHPIGRLGSPNNYCRTTNSFQSL